VRAIAQSIRTAGPAPSMAESLLGMGIAHTLVRHTDGSSSIFDEMSGNQNPGADPASHDLGSGRAGFGNNANASALGSFGPAGAPGGSALGAAAGPGRH